MKERPILFSAPMVRAILSGQKTQTRRAVKPQPYIDTMGNFCWNGGNFGQGFDGPLVQAIASPIPSSKTGRVLCPYGKPGDRLWVRETFQRFSDDGEIMYRADPASLQAMNELKYDECQEARWRPSIHMPRWASRILLEVVSVRVERLQEISKEDLAAEGIQELIDGGIDHDGTPLDTYCTLWESINGAGSWDKNPWVWVVEFKRIESPKGRD